MQLRTLSPPRARHPAESSSLRRALAALLRRRLRWLPGAVAPRLVQAARLAPVLLHASFERSRLKEDAPGVTGLRYRRSWSTLAREFDLPAPFKVQRGAALVEAVVALPRAGSLEVLVLAAPGLRPSDVEWVELRTAAAAAALAQAGARLEFRVTDAASLARDPEQGPALALSGALLAGAFSAASWGALESAARRPLEPAAAARLAAGVASPLAALSLTLLAGGPSPAPLAAAARLLAAGVPARILADPDELATRWAAEATPQRPLLEAALGLCRPHAGAPAAALDSGAVLELGWRLALAAARAYRRSRRHVPRQARAAWRDALGPGFPRALLPALGQRLAGPGPLRTALTRAERLHQVRLPGGAVLGRGLTPVQARVRALSVLASAALEPLLEHAEPPWRAVASRLAQRHGQPTLLLVVEPAAPSGPPFDPLNRGPERVIGFPGALEVRQVPGRRPSGRVLPGALAVERLVAAVQAGTALEVVPSRSEAHPVAARLAQVCGLVRQARGQPEVALEAGGQVIVPRAGRAFRYTLDRYLARPRRFRPDPDAPDLALSPGERRPVGLSAAGLIECRASLVDDQRAALLYADAHHGRLREVVFLSELEDHLRDARLLLQQVDPSSLLAVRLSEDVEPALRRVGRAGAPVWVAVRGILPGDLQLEVAGERYGGGSGLGWPEAARAVLARWPSGGEGRVGVNAVTVQAGGRRAVGLLALSARSIVLRRLRTFMVRELRSYRSGEAIRRSS
jgi:hypothetical protein